jgi:hypothetical protein
MTTAIRRVTCSVEGCGKQTTARSWCQTHYSRWKRTGVVGTVTLSAVTHQPDEAVEAEYTARSIQLLDKISADLDHIGHVLDECTTASATTDQPK